MVHYFFIPHFPVENLKYQVPILLGQTGKYSAKLKIKPYKRLLKQQTNHLPKVVWQTSSSDTFPQGSHPRELCASSTQLSFLFFIPTLLPELQGCKRCQPHSVLRYTALLFYLLIYCINNHISDGYRYITGRYY